jgi:archaemetzincin
MNRSLLYCCLAILLAVSCTDRKQRLAIKTPPRMIGMLPFERLDKQLVTELKQNLEKKYHLKVVILPERKLPGAAYYPVRRRYIADSLLVFLKKEDSNRFARIIGITTHDISTKKGQHANWGVMGYGYCPGKSCVISSFRVKPTIKDNAHFIKRMTILAMHELGHTWSLPHCLSDVCIMKDAEGKMNLDDAEDYCAMCRWRLEGQGVLKAE